MVRLPAKLTGLDITRFKDTVNSLIDCVAASRLVADGRTMRLRETPAGVVVSAIPAARMAADAAPEPGEYSGNFAVTKYSSTQSAIASGVVVINGTRYLVTGLTMTISATVTICLDVMAVAQSGASATGRFVAVSGTVTNAYYIPLAAVTFSSGAITTISQIYTGERLSEAVYWSES